jgi:hypothetical protein
MVRTFPIVPVVPSETLLDTLQDSVEFVLRNQLAVTQRHGDINRQRVGIHCDFLSHEGLDSKVDLYESFSGGVSGLVRLWLLDSALLDNPFPITA